MNNYSIKVQKTPGGTGRVRYTFFLSQLRAFSSTYSLLVALLLFSYLSPQVMSMAYLPPSL